jgi:hypothetical protein
VRAHMTSLWRPRIARVWISQRSPMEPAADGLQARPTGTYALKLGGVE